MDYSLEYILIIVLNWNFVPVCLDEAYNCVLYRFDTYVHDNMA